MDAADIGIQTGDMMNQFLFFEKIQRTIGEGRLVASDHIHDIAGGQSFVTVPQELKHVAALFGETQPIFGAMLFGKAHGVGHAMGVMGLGAGHKGL